MGAMKNILSRNNRMKGNKAKTSKMGVNAAGTITETDLGRDLMLINEELRGTVFPKAVDMMSTLVRKQAVQNLKLGGGAGSVGMSIKTGTRGVLTQGANGPYMKGGWSRKVLAKRGADKPSMARNGGKNGKFGIITKTSKRRGGGWGITGPVYGFDDKSNSRTGHNHAHTLEFGAKGHKKWGKKVGKPLPPRPFLGPAADQTRGRQIMKLKTLLRKWGREG